MKTELTNLKASLDAVLALKSHRNTTQLQFLAGRLAVEVQFQLDHIARMDYYAKLPKDELITVSFAHDLENGWYVVTLPNGRRVEFNDWYTIKESGILTGACVWLGAQHYMPDDFNSELYVYVPPNLIKSR